MSNFQQCSGQPLYTIKMVSEFLSCSQDHVANLCMDGQIVASDIARAGAKQREIRVRPEDLFDFVERKKICVETHKSGRPVKSSKPKAATAAPSYRDWYEKK